MQLRFFVHGQPKPAGSKRYLGHSKAGKAIIADDSGKAGADWRRQVAQVAGKAREDAELPLIRGAIKLDVIFFRARPKGHFGTGKNKNCLKLSAPLHCVARPDRGKLLRALEDGLKGVIYADDAQITGGSVCKAYGMSEGCEVTVWAIEGF